MRRSKIKPSINLASRRSVSAPAQPKDRGSTAAPKTTSSTDNAPKPTKERENVNAKPTRERKSSQSERIEDVSNKEVITKVAPPASLPLKDTTKQLDSVPQPANGLKDSDDQPTNPAVSKSPSSTTSGASEVSTKTTASAVKRKRFSAVPNLGQPRLRPTGQRSEVVSAKPSTADSVAQEQKENEDTASAVIKRPPPVQRLTSVPSINTKDDTPSTGNTTEGREAPNVTAAKSTEITAVQNAPKATPIVTSKTSDQHAIGDGKMTEVDGKRAGPRANVYSKKLKELKDQIDDETPSKRRKRHGTSNNPAQGKMTMSDLIYYNPKANPMKVSEADKQNKKSKTDPQKKKVTFANNEEEPADNHKDPEDDATMAPQVKIGPDGEIIIDQNSLYVQASPAKTFDVTETEIVHEDSSNTTYSSFRKRTRTATWTDKENQRFYMALSAVGTDFTTMNAMFPARTRAEIKRKFKKEDRQNHSKVNTALLNRQELNMSLFDPPSEDSDEESVKAKKKANSKEKKGSRKTKKNVPIENDEDSEVIEEVEAEAPEVADDSRTDALSSAADSQDEAEPNLANILSTTRSGRQPKVRTSYTIQIPPKLNRKRTRASPRDSSSTLKVFDDYAKHRIQRLQDEHEATLTLKRLAKGGVSGDTEEESEDGRSDMTSEMMSEVGSEIGNEEIGGVNPAGLTTNLPHMKTFLRSSPSAGPSGSQLGGVLSPGSTGGFSSPESISDPNVKKVTLKITTPDGKQTVVQVNLAAGGSILGQVNGSGLLVDNGSGRVGGTPALPRGGPAQMHAGHFLSPQTSPHSMLSPARMLTTLANVSSPYQRDSSQSQKIRTVLSTGETQPSKQLRNVTAAKIVDGKIVLCPPSPAESTPTRTLQDVRPVVHPNLSVQHDLSSPHSSHPQTSVQTGHPLQTPAFPHRTYIGIPQQSTTPCPPKPSVEAPPIPITTENVSTDPLLTIDSLNELDMSMAFAGNLAGDLGMVAYEESIETISDNIVAQQVNVASTNDDVGVPRPKRKKQKEQEPFIPPIK